MIVYGADQLTKLGEGKEAIALKPDYYQASYNKACAYTFQGAIEPALENLERAIHLSPDEYREMAKTDPDFDAIRGDSRFQALLDQAG